MAHCTSRFLASGSPLFGGLLLTLRRARPSSVLGVFRLMTLGHALFAWPIFLYALAQFSCSQNAVRGNIDVTKHCDMLIQASRRRNEPATRFAALGRQQTVGLLPSDGPKLKARFTPGFFLLGIRRRPQTKRHRQCRSSVKPIFSVT